MQNPVIVNQKESIIPVFAYPKESEQGKETPFSNIIGHERQKKELLLVLEWFKHCEEWRQKGVYVPKGIILFGSPGNGKSLFMKEIIRCAGLPTFVYKGEESNIVEGLVETFEQAKKEVKSIVVIDELDLLIDRESRVTRALQEILDGVESMNNILVIAATNDIDEIPCALLRSGRLDKRISIENPTAEECLDMLRKALGDFGAIFPEEADEREIGNLLHGDSYADIKAIANDIILRNGIGKIAPSMIDESIGVIHEVVIRKEAKSNNREVAIHEAGHAVMAHAFPEFFQPTKLSIRDASGEFRVSEVEENFWPYDKVIADIRVSMAGILAQKIICGRGSRGCEKDLQRARIHAYNLMNDCGFSSCWETLPQIKSSARIETPAKRRRMERKIERFLKRQEKATSRYLKRHRKEIIKIGELLYQKKRLNPSEIIECFETRLDDH